MARTVEEIQSDIDSLKAVLAQGVSSTSFADRRVDYVPGSDIEVRIARLEAEKASLSSPRRPKCFYASSEKGF